MDSGSCSGFCSGSCSCSFSGSGSGPGSGSDSGSGSGSGSGNGSNSGSGSDFLSNSGVCCISIISDLRPMRFQQNVYYVDLVSNLIKSDLFIVFFCDFSSSIFTGSVVENKPKLKRCSSLQIILKTGKMPPLHYFAKMFGSDEYLIQFWLRYNTPVDIIPLLI